ncbi:MAG: tyrosine-type recombinase/integrase [Candidatus Obscuribacter sp.]|nr:tyrosine-type recombinase/integrase [Candidatus Obscuribacter sp.]
MAKLTKEFVENEIHLTTSGQRFYRDDDVPGFAIRVTRKCKSYILERRIAGASRRITIGKCSDISFDSAKSMPALCSVSWLRVTTPEPASASTLFETSHCVKCYRSFSKSASTRRDPSQLCLLHQPHLSDWLDLPITAITKDMVEQRHQELTSRPNRLGTSGHGRANNALKKLGSLINFASDRFGNDDELLLKENPVSRLSRNRSWHRIHPRRGIIPDHKLRDWYLAVSSLPHEVSRDFLLFLLLTGLRCGEARRLKWTYVDFHNKLLTIPRSQTKSDREHQLPLTDFLIALLRKRYVYRNHSEWVFQSCRLRNKHLSPSHELLKRVTAKSSIHFTFHDLRRTFLTMAEKQDVPPYALKRLVNHSVSSDTTGHYLILDIERLRKHMVRITDAFIEQLGIIDTKTLSLPLAGEKPLTEVTQLLIPLGGLEIL